MSGNPFPYDTLFLDRDGVINVHRPGDYVKSWEEFVFEEGIFEAMELLSGLFRRIVVVTNQRGVGRGLLEESTLQSIHEKMKREIESRGGRIDRVFYCTDTDPSSPDRKPNTGMGRQAKEVFPDLDFTLSYVAGDSESDMEFGRRLGMRTARIGNGAQFRTLLDFALFLRSRTE